MRRPDKHETWLQVAHIIAGRGTCARRRVGCVLVNKEGFVLSTGYNGVAPGMLHCTDAPCAGVQLISGTGLSICEAIHAEANALLSCRDLREVDVIYSTTEPCVDCVKLLLRTHAREVYFIESYPSSGRELWERAGRAWRQHHTATLLILDALARGRPVSDATLQHYAASQSRID